MKETKLFIMLLGISNVIAGIILTTFIILMQNPLALVLGVLYILFSIGIFRKIICKKLLFWGIIPLTILFSFNIIMLSLDKDVPEYFQIPLFMGLLIVLPLWLLIFGDIYIFRTKWSMK